MTPFQASLSGARHEIVIGISSVTNKHVNSQNTIISDDYFDFWPKIYLILYPSLKILDNPYYHMTSHHEKFEAELAQIEETYNAKKTKFLDSSEEFNKELKKHCVPAVDDTKYKGGIISESAGGFLYLKKHIPNVCLEPLSPYIWQ